MLVEMRYSSDGNRKQFSLLQNTMCLFVGTVAHLQGKQTNKQGRGEFNGK